ncbi:MAG: hypothetical protein IJ273_03605, partial [Alphaproteobacteria bacterium]|nr:hypothetical protein [Alphaproteobacteria bacterium]
VKDNDGNEVKTPVLANDSACDATKMKAPSATATDDTPATAGTESVGTGDNAFTVITKKFDADSWCTQQLKSGRNQICPFGGQITQSSGDDFTNSYCKTGGENGKVLSNLPEGIK